MLCVDRDATLADAIAAEVDGVPWAADVTNEREMRRLFGDGVAALGRPLHGLADIVGMATTKPLTEIDAAAWDAQFAVVLRHAYLALRIGGPLLAAAGGGSMVFVGSLAGNLSVASQGAYGAAKAALHHLVRTSARELGPQNVRVNAVAPGNRANAAASGETSRRDVAPLRRGDPAAPDRDADDIAAAIAFLLSDWARMISGAVLPVDGALSTVSAVPDLGGGSTSSP